MSQAVVVSRTTAMSGAIVNDAAFAPRVPISSCTVNAYHASYSGSPLIISIMIRQPARSSIALLFTNPSPKRNASLSNTAQSPRLTSFSASSRVEAPMSISMSENSGAFLRSSADC